MAGSSALYLNSNNLWGTLPSELGKLSGMTYWEFHDNKLGCGIPVSSKAVFMHPSLSNFNISLGRFGRARFPACYILSRT